MGRTKWPKPYHQDLLPEKYRNEEFVNTWIQFHKYRREIKKPLTYLACKRIINKFNKNNLTTEQAERALDKSMIHNWIGVHP